MFLGLDLGTQSLKAILISQNLTLIDEFFVNFNQELKNYSDLDNGVKIENSKATCPSLSIKKNFSKNKIVWIEALDLLFQKMKKKNIHFEEIKCISGSGKKKNEKKIFNFLKLNNMEVVIFFFINSFHEKYIGKMDLKIF